MKVQEATLGIDLKGY